MSFVLVVWYITIIVQSFFGYGTAYRLTKSGGDCGASLFGWLIAMQLAALIPGLGFFLWKKYREDPDLNTKPSRPSRLEEIASPRRKFDDENNKW